MQNQATYYTNISVKNCYPFGMTMPGRSYTSESYRFGFQGQEKNNDISGVDGGHLDFKYRIHDARLGRFLSVDPLSASYPWNSTYAFSENRVIDSKELEGAERQTVHVLENSDGSTTILKTEDHEVFGALGTGIATITYNLNSKNIEGTSDISPISIKYETSKIKGQEKLHYDKSKDANGWFEKMFKPDLPILELDARKEQKMVNRIVNLLESESSVGNNKIDLREAISPPGGDGTFSTDVGFVNGISFKGKIGVLDSEGNSRQVNLNIMTTITQSTVISSEDLMNASTDNYYIKTGGDYPHVLKFYDPDDYGQKSMDIGFKTAKDAGDFKSTFLEDDGRKGKALEKNMK